MRLPLLILVLTAAPADACSVPVFRYALERWAPSPYEALVFHRGQLSDVQLRRLSDLEEAKLNVTVRTIDLDGPLRAEHRSILGDNAAPWVSVRYPDGDDKTPAVWAGPLDRLPATLGDSPARRELVKLLGRGTAVVWVLLDGDAATKAMLRGELARLEKALELPEVDPADLKSRLPLKLSFAVVELSREGADADLARELLDSDEELRRVKGPVLFPVVGRGRMLFGLHGKGLTAREVAQAASFACGACSCQVKELNPGIDLLLRADWQAMLDVAGDDEEAPAVTAPPIPPGSRPPEVRPAGTGPWVVPAALLAVVAVGVVWRAAARKGCSCRFWQTSAGSVVFGEQEEEKMDPVTFRAETPLQALIVEHALAMARQLEQTANGAADGRVLGAVEAFAVPAGRELVRKAVEATLQAQADSVEKKVPLPAAAGAGPGG